jgi:hypothetical protein
MGLCQRPLFTRHPATNIVASGKQGGPFHPSSFQYELRASAGNLNYLISGIPPWLNANFTSGTVTTSPITVTFQLTNVHTLSRGTYQATIEFTNTTNGRGNTSRTATLRIEDDEKNRDDLE